MRFLGSDFACFCESDFCECGTDKLINQNREENAVANKLLYSMKRDNRADVREFLADELADALKGFLRDRDDVIFTNVPRRRAAIVEFGMDHAADLAKLLAKHFDCEYRSLLVSKTEQAQKTTHGKEREKKETYDEANKLNLNVIDLTCPKVLKIREIRLACLWFLLFLLFLFY